MTLTDLLKTEINFNDLSENEQELLHDKFYKSFPDTFAWLPADPANEEYVSAVKKIKEVVKPVRVNRLKKNIEIFNEFRRYCNNQYPDKPFANYLCGTRRLPERKILDFKLFFVVNYFEVNNHLKKEFELADLQRSGLYSRKENGTGNLIFYNHRIIIPYIRKGEIVYLRARYFDKECNATPLPGNSKYMGLSNDTLDLNRTKRFFNSQIIERLFEGERLLIVEGELDTIAGTALGFNTIGVPGAQNIPPLSDFKKLLKYEIILCGDNDNAGSEMQNKITQIFMDLKKEITIKQLNTKDLNDFLAA